LVGDLLQDAKIRLFELLRIVWFIKGQSWKVYKTHVTSVIFLH